jgi:hypothetical protein
MVAASAAFDTLTNTARVALEYLKAELIEPPLTEATGRSSK